MIHPTARAVLVLAVVATASLTCAAEEAKPDQITLEDIIFDAKYLKKFLGPKTLVTAVVETTRARKKSSTALGETIKAINDAQLAEKSVIYSLPEAAIQPKLKSSIPHTYPPGLKISRQAKKADFLIFIGGDGAVKCLYCYSTNDRLFALAAAMAVVKWQYEPAKIQGTAVPVLAGLPMQFEISDVNAEAFKSELRRKAEAGRPVPLYMPPPVVRPPPPSNPPR